MIYFTSDTHFGYDGIILREKRPFKNFRQFQRKVIGKWNKKINKQDTLYVLGDFVDYNNKDLNSWPHALNLVKKIKAKVILIIGNNEQRVIDRKFGGDFSKFRDYCLMVGFLDVKNDDYLEIEDKKFYLNHFPSKHKDGYINLFGHVHRSTGLWKPFGLNIGVDLNYFDIYSLDDIYNLLKDKAKWWDGDIDTISM